MLAAIAAVAKWEESWEDPGARFTEWLRDCVMRAVRGFCQQGKPGSLGREESVQVYRKAVNVVLDNEEKAGPAFLSHMPLPNNLLCAAHGLEGLHCPPQEWVQDRGLGCGESILGMARVWP